MVAPNVSPFLPAHIFRGRKRAIPPDIIIDGKIRGIGSPNNRRDMYTLHHGNCVSILPTLPENSIDSIVCDPPYELGFMGKSWDASGIAYSVKMWQEALRVLKPGGHLLAFSGSRTYHRMTCAIEDAGFEVRDQILWVYGSGFPKSLDVSKAIDKSRGGFAFDELRAYLREVIRASGTTHKVIKRHLGYPEDSGVIGHWVGNSQPGIPLWADWQKLKGILPIDDRYDDLLRHEQGEIIGKGRSAIANKGEGERYTVGASTAVEYDVIAPATEAAKQWQGWGTALKPAHEPICVARKPLAKGLTVAANVLAHGTGALNIDGCRVATNGEKTGGSGNPTKGVELSAIQPGRSGGNGGNITPDAGRWPANLIHDGSDEVLAAFPQAPGQQCALSGDEPSAQTGNVYGVMNRRSPSEPRVEIDKSAARFFYCAKTSKKDRNEGLDAFTPDTTSDGRAVAADNAYQRGKTERANTHPTVKPTDLMRYLCRLVTPPGGTVLDPFMGSGSTGKAAMLEGFVFVGIEMDETYHTIAKARIDAAAVSLFADIL